MIVIFLIYRAFHSETDDARFFIFDGVWEGKVYAEVQGEVDYLELRREEDTISTSVYLKEVIVVLEKKEYFLKRLLVYLDGELELNPGNEIWVSGNLKEFTQPTNPGQFDQRAYYKEKGIYYQFQADELKVTDSDFLCWKKSLYQIRDRIANVYENTLPEKECGIITAMILGDKSVLDMDVKKLYQASGIGHILAISGLHVTILGMALYRFLQRLGVSVKFRVFLCVILLLCYGRMTNFSVSTSRAVIMMILFLAAECIGRSYDAGSALAFSGIIILLQKPFALFSCSFLLSFGAILGLNLIQPVLKLLLCGGKEKQRERKRRLRRWKKEVVANYSYGKLLVYLQRLLEKVISMLLGSISVQLMTLPVMLYFFFEVPLYGIIINLFVIPLASVLVLLAFIGGIAGCICIPVGKFLLGTVYFILQFYEKICLFFQQLPGQLQILGRPSWYEILMYYAILFGFLLMVCQIVERKGQASKWLWLVPAIMVVFLLPFPKKEFFMTFLDVGQGDGIFIQSPTGTNILLDGGSTSVSQVGTYRILPFLKCNGVRRIDYMIMTHSDEDHISGLIEILEGMPQHGVQVGQIMLPEVKDTTEFQEVLELAEKHKITVSYLSAGDYWSDEELELVCLNPVAGAEPDSSNEGSVTLSLKYQDFSCLLTGDLEGDGEEQVEMLLEGIGEVSLEKISEVVAKKNFAEDSGRKQVLPDEYTILKVAHHGSKNSSGEDMLNSIKPKLAVISCGKGNRYGHPHEETLERLQEVGSEILVTAECGAITVEVHKEIEVRSWLYPE